MADTVRPHVRDRVLEIGSGIGNLTRALVRGRKRYAATDIRSRAYVELLREPDLSVVVFRRLGWSPSDYYDWSDRLLKANFAFVTPTTHEGETITRFAILNPRTTEGDIATILDTMA